MKRLEKEIVTKTTEYIWEASDGETFDNMEACKKHESTYFCTLKTWFMAIPHEKIYGYGLGVPYCCEEDECYVFIPQCEEDVKKINLMIAFIDKNKKLLNIADVRCPIVINFGYEGCSAGCDYIYWKRVDDLISGIRKEYDSIISNIN